MTDQPAAPTPGPLVCSLCGQGGFRSIGVLPNVEHNLLDCGIATAAERDQMAAELQHINAVLARRPALDNKLSRIDKILHAIETAAERDRLVKLLHWVAFEPIGHPESSASEILAEIIERARTQLAALDEARKP